MENSHLPFIEDDGCLGINPVEHLHLDPEGGYYPVVLGIYNRRNFEGQYIRALDLAKIQEGRTRFGVELSQPRRLPGQTFDDFSQRVMRIQEERVVGYIQDLAELTLPNGHQLVYGKFFAKGPMADAALELLNNPDEWFSFGHRILGHIGNYEVGFFEEFKVMHFVTWDLVGGKPKSAKETLV